ncbi:hypothetical protein GGE45_002539 [Rhizobium aethiopicum]|uniref:Uncharacterized protein n=1 Tax=Rhizobium aethiopicum TaxID=1138170 RepID=A0A7W6Q803_9HYPH|nr:hypothetical protein [Rhizobium aethiopicum]MBB4190052.1 hypothetical protein [Rhizobium aethiopicum]MBB4580209.1 hypothetical protein [Rhizobium aethiopicum]
MSLSPKNLAKLLNEWDDSYRISISESHAYLTVRGVREEDAKAVLEGLRSLDWPIEVEDASQAPVPVSKIENGLPPFKFTCKKPDGQSSMRILTNEGLRTWLGNQEADPVVELGALDEGFATYATTFVPWGEAVVEVSRPALDTNPRRLVREVGERLVPENVSRFVLLEGSHVPAIDGPGPASVWAGEASRAMARSLCSEIDGSEVMFRGPPACRYLVPADFANELGEDGFCHLTNLARWVFEFSAEAETRHGLAVAELARWPANGQCLADLYKDSGAAVLESAKIAHQLGLSKISSDSMKTLSDLRKNVADEASKLNDVTRQLAGAVASALFGGAAVVIARLSLKDATLGVDYAIISIGIVLFGYVCLVAYSGHRFIQIQSGLRSQWREKLYRFLSNGEYKEMVMDPAKDSEQMYYLAAIAGVILAFVLSVSLIVMGAMLISGQVAARSSQAEPAINSALENVYSGVSLAICSSIAVATLPVSWGTGLGRHCRPNRTHR